VAGVLLGLLDAAVSAPPLLPQFSSQEAWAEFVLRLTLLPILPLLAGAALVTSATSLFAALAQRMSARRPGASASGLLAWLLALGALPYVVWVCGQLFTGPRAQKLPARHLLAALLGLAAIVGIRTGIALVMRARLWAQAAPLRSSALALLGLAPTVAFYALDRWVLVRLYPWFHLTLELLAAACAGASALFILDALAPPGSGVALRRIAPRFRALGLVLLLLLSGLLSRQALVRLHGATVLRGLVLERTTLGSQLMRVYAGFRARRPGVALPPSPPVVTEREPPPPPYSGPRLDGRDVFLLTVDALRFDRLRPQTMPFVSELARGGVAFARAYTQVPHTSFAIATLLTGKPVYALMALGHEVANHETLPLILRRFRYKTAAFYPPAVFYIEHERLKRLEESAYGFEYVKYEYLPAPRRTDQVIAFLESEHPAHAFVWVHYFEPHEPYEPHDGGPGAQASDSDRYDGEVRFVDGEIQRLLTYLKRTRPGALVIIAADHGEEFSEHGGRYHGTSLYEEQVHVPLVFAELTPTPTLRARQLAQPVGLIDVAPTLLGLLDIERSALMRGRDLSPWLLTGATELPHHPIYAEIGRQKMVVVDQHKLICDLGTDTCQSFNLLADPAERQNTIDSAPADGRRLRATLDHFLDESRRFESSAIPPRTSSGVHSGDDATLARARLGDRQVLPQLVELLGRPGVSPVLRRQVLALLSELLASAPLPAQAGPDPLLAEPALRDPKTLELLREQLASAQPVQDMPVEVQRRWAAIALVRLAAPTLAASDPILKTVTTLIDDPQGEARQRLSGALVLAALPACRPPTEGRVSCVALWAKALPAALSLEDPDVARPLIQLLGRSRDPRARLPLVQELGSVRSRPDLVAALGQLGDRAAVPALAATLAQDPYVHVRAAAAKALGALGGPAAVAALSQAASQEREAPVQAAISAALLAHGPAAPAPALPPAVKRPQPTPRKSRRSCARGQNRGCAGPPRRTPSARRRCSRR